MGTRRKTPVYLVLAHLPLTGGNEGEQRWAFFSHIGKAKEQAALWERHYASVQLREAGVAVDE